jgi:DNA-binding NarL/FixJ family response regulator
MRTGSDIKPVSCVIRVAVAEDHRLMREGLRSLLEPEPCIQVVGEADDGLKAVELVNKEKPDVLLLDLRIPRLHGIEVLRQLQDQSETKVLVVSMHSEESYLLEALRNRATGYILKDCSSSELIEAIRTVARGEQYLCGAVKQKAVAATLKRLLPGRHARGLTKRELIVLELAAEGKSSAQIAEALFISRRTAEAHRANLMKKLGLKTQTELVLYAVRSGLIAP